IYEQLLKLTMNYYREKKIVLLVKECVFVTKPKSTWQLVVILMVINDGHHTRYLVRRPSLSVYS
ncbi:MAG: hypothetical protein WBP84_06820, partial [Nitrososphaeraceae archaeon]